MLLNNFFTYKQVDSEIDSVQAIINFNESHDIYKGHFPQRPVTPGVCQIEALKEVLSDCLHKKLKLKEAKEIKYIVPHTPEVKDVLLQAKLKDSEGDISVSASLSKDDQIFMKIRACFEQL